MIYERINTEPIRNRYESSWERRSKELSQGAEKSPHQIVTDEEIFYYEVERTVSIKPSRFRPREAQIAGSYITTYFSHSEHEVIEHRKRSRQALLNEYFAVDRENQNIFRITRPENTEICIFSEIIKIPRPVNIAPNRAHDFVETYQGKLF